MPEHLDLARYAAKTIKQLAATADTLIERGQLRDAREVCQNLDIAIKSLHAHLGEAMRK